MNSKFLHTILNENEEKNKKENNLFSSNKQNILLFRFIK